MKVIIIDYGAGNIQSIQFAFQRLGINAKLSNSIDEILSADKVIFPGVGEASQAMQMLEKSKLNLLIPNLKQEVLGICLGMQLLCKHTEEGNTKGLGVFDVDVKRFSNAVKVPHMGWNTIQNLQSGLLNNISEDSYMYSVHSYYASIGMQTIACSEYELEFSAALQSDNFYGVQFHPEKSSKDGAQLLQNFLNL
jgi:imidazole glycerol-phosphate synthase subunit HisH